DPEALQAADGVHRVFLRRLQFLDQGVDGAAEIPLRGTPGREQRPGLAEALPRPAVGRGPHAREKVAVVEGGVLHASMAPVWRRLTPATPETLRSFSMAFSS